MLGLNSRRGKGGGWQTVHWIVFPALGLASATSLSVMVASEQAGEASNARAPVALAASASFPLNDCMEAAPMGDHQLARGECDLYRNLRRNTRPWAVKVPDSRRNAAAMDERSTTDEGSENVLRAVTLADISQDSDRPAVQSLGEPRLFVEAIIQHPGPLCLGGIDALPASVADAIRRRLSPTELPHVAVLTVEAASVLTEHGGVHGTVWFESIGRIEPGAIEALLTMNMNTPQNKKKPDTPRPAALIILPDDLKKILTVEQVHAIEAHTTIHFGTQHGP